MGQIFRNNFATTLTGDITTSSTSLVLTAAPLPTITLSASDDFFLLTIVNDSGTKEVVKCVGISGLTVTIGTVLGTPSVAGRAQENTTAIPITYTDDHVISMRVTRGTLESIVADIATLEADTAIATSMQAAAGTDNVQPLSSARGREVIEGYIPKASQSQAEAGTNDTSRMSPLRVAQAIEAQTELAFDSSPTLAGHLDQSWYTTYFKSEIPSHGWSSGEGFEGTIDVNAQGIGAPLYCSADGNYDTCDANVAGTLPCRCLAMESGTGAGKKMFSKGFFRNDAWNWALIGKDIYVGTNIGELTQTLVGGTGDTAQVVGYAVTSNVMYFNPNYVMIELL